MKKDLKAIPAADDVADLAVLRESTNAIRKLVGDFSEYQQAVAVAEDTRRPDDVNLAQTLLNSYITRYLSRS